MPLFSIITPVYDTPAKEFREMVQSVLDQSFADWEFVLVNDNSPAEHVAAELAWAEDVDSRIRVIHREKNGGISAASNDALTAAIGDFVVLLDHDDTLTEDALELMAAAIDENPDVDYLYSDEDKLSLEGEFVDVHRKPPWSPERFRHQMYTCHLSVLRANLTRDVGGFDSSMDGSQDHDIVLRVTEKARGVVHVPKVLYHWRVMPGSTALGPDEKPYAWQAGVRAVDAHLKRLGLDAEATLGPSPGHYSIARVLPPDYRISVVLPTRGDSSVVWGKQRVYVLDAIRSVLARTGHRNIEFVVVYDVGETPPKVIDEVARIVPAQDLVLVPYDGAFNLSRKYNLGVIASSGKAIVLMNDDVEANGDHWLEALVGPLLEHGVGLTGARVLSREALVQHAGYAISSGGYRDAFRDSFSDTIGHFGLLKSSRECSAVALVCAALRRDVFDEAGGVNEVLATDFGDIDLSFKISHLGYRVLYVAEAEVFHFSDRPRLSFNPAALGHLQRRWGIPMNAKDDYLPDF
ncbi:MAG TPA: glycosyltransferase [Jatrophihabitans sp.]|jgi:glycosyltransferase involved in cell wall biosynthesis